MNKYDLEHKLLKGGVIYIGKIPIYSVKLSQMVDFKYGYTACSQLISLLCVDDDKVQDLLVDGVEKTTFNFICGRIYAEISLVKEGKVRNDELDNLTVIMLPQFMELLFHDKVVFDIEKMRFVIGNENEEKYLDSSNYEEFKTILKERNCLDYINDEDENPSNEMAKRLIEQRKKLREKLKKVKSPNDGEDLTMADLISIFAEAESLSLPFVYDNYDVYQFNNQFSRLRIMSDYDVNIRALLSGAKSEDVQLQHWISKIKKQDD